jgi:hypothetical protein
MLPGPILIIKAPGCTKLLKQSTLASGNTFGATFWTDGKMEAPMLPDKPWLMKSPSEGVLFWTDECEVLGEISFFSEEPENLEWEDLEFAEEPDEADYLAVISKGFADTPEKMRYTRIRFWWQGNDRIRCQEWTELPYLHIENLTELLPLLADDDASQRVMKAEVLRELSLFDESLKLLSGNFPSDFQQAVGRIRELALSGICRVEML